MLYQESIEKIDFVPEFLLITFSSASHCMETEKKARGSYKTHVIPTPREITMSCGMALRFGDCKVEEMSCFFERLDVPAKLFALSERGEDKKRRTQLLGEIH